MTEVAHLALPSSGQMYPMYSQQCEHGCGARSHSRPKNRMAVFRLRDPEGRPELRVSRTFVDQLRPQLFSPSIPNSMRCQHFRSSLGVFLGMVQILGFSGNSTDRPHASTVEVLSVVGPMAGSGTLVAVKAQYV